MARRPSRKSSPRRNAAAAARTAETPREKIIAALMALLEEKPFEEIGLSEIAQEAGLSLAEMRDVFPSKMAILAAQIKAIDRAVLSGTDEAAMSEESPRDRLFDVLMRRIDALSPHKEALRSLMRSAARNPGLALALNGLAVRSQQWMLTAAGIPASGPKGMLRSQGLALLFANVLRTWVDDDDDNTLTLAALDRELARGQRFAGLLDDLCRIPQAACNLRQRMHESARRGRRRDRDDRVEA